MEYLIGVILALAVVGFAALIGLDSGRVVYPTVVIVITSYYIWDCGCLGWPCA